MAPIIPEKETQAIKEKLAEDLKKSVRLTLFVEPEATLAVPGRPPTLNKETKQLVEEIVALSDKISLTAIDPAQETDVSQQFGVDKVPAIVLDADSNHNMRFFGFPGGFEFATFLQSMIMASQGKSGLSLDAKLALAKIDRDIQVQVFTTPTCPHCPTVAAMAMAMALENPYIKAEVIESTEFPHLVAKYQISGVPTVILSDTFMFVGAEPEESFVDAVMQTYNKLRSSVLEIPTSGKLQMPGQKKNEPPTGGSSSLIIAR